MELHKQISQGSLAGNLSLLHITCPRMTFTRTLVQSLMTNHSCILQTDKTSTIWRMTSFAAKSMCNLFLQWGLSVCVAKYGEILPSWPFSHQGTLEALHSVLKDCFLNLFATLQLETLRVGTCLQATLPIVTTQTRICVMALISLWSLSLYYFVHC